MYKFLLDDTLGDNSFYHMIIIQEIMLLALCEVGLTKETTNNTVFELQQNEKRPWQHQQSNSRWQPGMERSVNCCKPTHFVKELFLCFHTFCVCLFFASNEVKWLFFVFSVNFLLYMFGGSKFRNDVKNIFCCRGTGYVHIYCRVPGRRGLQ